MEFKNTEHLIKFLENWVAFDGDDYAYDVNGIFAIIAACLRNLKKHSIEGDFENLDEVFTEDEIEVLQKIFNGTKL